HCTVTPLHGRLRGRYFGLTPAPRIGSRRWFCGAAYLRPATSARSRAGGWADAWIDLRIGRRVDRDRGVVPRKRHGHGHVALVPSIRGHGQLGRPKVVLLDPDVQRSGASRRRGAQRPADGAVDLIAGQGHGYVVAVLVAAFLVRLLRRGDARRREELVETVD